MLHAIELSPSAQYREGPDEHDLEEWIWLPPRVASLVSERRRCTVSAVWEPREGYKRVLIVNKLLSLTHSLSLSL
jgi:hypothetical protein